MTFICTCILYLDLVEGESELASGYNVEYRGVGAAAIFVGEYGVIMFLHHTALSPTGATAQT